MALLTNAEGIIENLKNGKKFYFRAITPFKNKKNQPSVDVPLINTTAQNRFIFRFTGQSQEVNFTFTLFDDGQDVSTAAGTGSIITVKQQAEYLMDEIFTHEFDADWALTIETQYSGYLQGVIDTIDLDTDVGGRIRTGNIVFKVGRIGDL